jgi:hypothetical protein
MKLGPEHLATRAGAGGGKLTYIEGWRVINLANEVFGFDGWSSEVKSLEVDFVRQGILIFRLSSERLQRSTRIQKPAATRWASQLSFESIYEKVLPERMLAMAKQRESKASPMRWTR